MKIYNAMGAKAVDKKDPLRLGKIDIMFKSDEYVGQRKLDGERILFHKKTDDVVRLFGRGYSKSNARMEKTLLLPHLISELQFLPGFTVLDGEVLFIPKIYEQQEIKELSFKEDFWKCREIMGSYPEKAIPQQELEGKLHFFVFDNLMAAGTDLTNIPYEDRYGILKNLFKDYIGFNLPHIHFLPWVEGELAKRQLLEDAMALGLEGIILKRRDSTYHEGKKPTGKWVKIKQEKEADGVIIGYSLPNQFTKITRDGMFVLDENGEPIEEESKYFQNDWIGAIWIGQYVEKVEKEHMQRYKEFGYDRTTQLMDQCQIDGVTMSLVPVAKISGMDEQLRADISANKEKFLGKVVKFNYFDQTDDSYFQPRLNCFRFDKSQRECVWE